jgi:hypothetical protein
VFHIGDVISRPIGGGYKWTDNDLAIMQQLIDEIHEVRRYREVAYVREVRERVTWED